MSLKFPHLPITDHKIKLYLPTFTCQDLKTFKGQIMNL